MLKKHIIFISLLFLFLPAGIAATSETRPPDVVILYTGDTRSEITPKGSCCGKSGGIRARESHIREMRNRFENVFLVDTGDYFWKDGKDALNGIKSFHARLAFDMPGYDALNIAEGEIADIRRLEGIQGLVSSNVTARHSHGSKWEPFLVREIGGLKLCILGFLSPDFAKDEKFTVADPVVAAGKILPEVSSKADIVVALSHLGWDGSRRLAEAVGGIDIIIVGHGDHENFEPERVKSSLLVKNAIGGSLAGSVKIWADRSGKIVKTETGLRILDKKIKTHPDYSGLERKYINEKYAYLGWLKKEIMKTLPDGEKQNFRRETTPVRKLLKYLNKRGNPPSFETFLSTRN